MNKNSKIEVSIAGASGYTGGELCRYLCGHPQVHVQSVLANTQAGQELSGLFPNLKGHLNKTLEKAAWSDLGAQSDVVFLCLPHGQSQEPVAQLLEQGCKVIDLGADFRLSDSAVYETAYGAPHRFPELLSEAVYGLPEKNREDIRGGRLVANPGCYPTASLLALLPIRDSLSGAPPVIDAKSGVSGAGRGLKSTSLFCEVNENFRAYGVGGHRHQPEIEQTVGQSVLFTPHLVPMTRGILATVYVKLSYDGLQKTYRDFYADEPFVAILDGDTVPSTKSVAGTNFCRLAVRPSGHPDYSIIISAIDNLGKGAAGTAVHNMNLLFGLPETTGLRAPALCP